MFRLCTSIIVRYALVHKKYGEGERTQTTLLLLQTDAYVTKDAVDSRNM